MPGRGKKDWVGVAAEVMAKNLEGAHAGLGVGDGSPVMGRMSQYEVECHFDGRCS